MHCNSILTIQKHMHPKYLQFLDVIHNNRKRSIHNVCYVYMHKYKYMQYQCILCIMQTQKTHTHTHAHTQTQAHRKQTHAHRQTHRQTHRHTHTQNVPRPGTVHVLDYDADIFKDTASLGQVCHGAGWLWTRGTLFD